MAQSLAPGLDRNRVHANGDGVLALRESPLQHSSGKTVVRRYRHRAGSSRRHRRHGCPVADHAHRNEISASRFSRRDLRSCCRFRVRQPTELRRPAINRSASSSSTNGASPLVPSTTRPRRLVLIHRSTLSRQAARSSSPSSAKGVGTGAKTPPIVVILATVATTTERCQMAPYKEGPGRADRSRPPPGWGGVASRFVADDAADWRPTAQGLWQIEAFRAVPTAPAQVESCLRGRRGERCHLYVQFAGQI